MELNDLHLLRRGVRAAVHRACWRRLEGDEPGSQATLAHELPGLLAGSSHPAAADEELVRTWIDDDTKDFERAVLISDLVAQRMTTPPAFAGAGPRLAHAPRPTDFPSKRPARRAGPPVIADLLDGMLEEDRRQRAAG